MENTTNINDLPMEPEMDPRVERDLREASREAPRPSIIDSVRESVRESPRESRRVRFADTWEHKTLILACLFFLLFNDTKVKIYLMNILVVIFGDALRTTGGGSTKVGQVFYTGLFGLTLWVSNLLVELRM